MKPRVTTCLGALTSFFNLLFELAFDFVFDFAVDFDLPPLGTQPFVCCRKWIRKVRCLSAASFGLFPFFAAHKRAPEGQVCGRLLLLTFSWRDKKSK
ncbi:MAG: hypothetical protein Q7T62_15490 [Undibacterium sp.]|nr:hypothetical protein [Undibacterium sp.]